MQLKDILKVKGSSVLTIEPTASLSDVVHKLVANRCGSLVVCQDEQMVGIISERDILRAVADADRPFDEVTVESRMTRDVVTGSPSDSINEIMGILTDNRVRHLPVLDDGKLAGLISIGDIVKAQHDQLAMENHLLMNYIQS